MAIEVGNASRAVSGQSKAEFGSDLVVELIRALGIPYVALNPGSSYRGLHDSFVNFEGGGPEIIVCCHEEIAVALAHGYASVTGKPLVAAVHNVVGLQHASMGIYSAWNARAPVIVIGGTGPVASANRRPGIDWVHTALVQGNQVRDYTKWDDQPASVASFPESVLRAYRIATTEPSGPVYLCFDVDLQEEPITTPIPFPAIERFQPPAPQGPNPDALDEAATLLANASFPVILAGSAGRNPGALTHLRELAEHLVAPVISTEFSLPTNHPLNLSEQRQVALREADVVLALDVVDLGASLGQLKSAKERDERPQLVGPDTKIIHITLFDLFQHSWASDFRELAPVDVPVAANTSVALPMLLELCRQRLDTNATRVQDRRAAIERMQAGRERAKVPSASGGVIPLRRVYADLFEAVQGLPWMLGEEAFPGWDITEHAQFPVSRLSGGLGLRMGKAMGTSIAVRDSGSDRFLIHESGDGELLFTPGSMWTLANLNLPILTIVNNNHMYGNDLGHQELMARVRNRPLENSTVGLELRNPNTDFAALARSFGMEAFGAVTDGAELTKVLRHAAEIVARERRPVLVDVVTG